MRYSEMIGTKYAPTSAVFEGLRKITFNSVENYSGYTHSASIDYSLSLLAKEERML